MEDVIYEFEASVVLAFRYPKEVRGDRAYASQRFIKHFKTREIKYRPLPPGKHSRDILECKQELFTVFLCD